MSNPQSSLSNLTDYSSNRPMLAASLTEKCSR